VKEEREWAVEGGKAVRVEALEADRASEEPRCAFNTTSSGDGTSKANGPSGASGMFAALAADDLCFDVEAFTLVIDPSRGDADFERP
jgi:hypothetical protein